MTEITILPDGRVYLFGASHEVLEALSRLSFRDGELERRLSRERKEHQIYSEMQTGRRFQMQTMDNALLELYQTGEITYDVALSNAHDPDFIRRRTGPGKKSGPA